MRLGSLILAGGRSTRMGRPKESLPFAGETLLARTVATMASCTAPVVVAARREQSLPTLAHDVDRIDDERTDRGPLPAIAGALRFLREHHRFTDRDAVFVTGCDAPFLSADVVRFLAARLGDTSLVMPRAGDFAQPLCAVWRLDTLAAIDTLLAQDVLAPHRIAGLVTTRIVAADELRAVDPELRSLRNVNSPADYERALADHRP